MSERRENSVLFSLKELRRIEDDRVKREEDEAKAKVEADRAAKEAAVRRAREDDERRRREEEDRVRQIEDAKEAKLREEQMRLQEAERRHRVEGELRLQEERMRLELQSRKSSSPVKAVVTVAAILVVVAGGLGYAMYSRHQAELAAVNLERERAAADAKAAQLESDRKVAAIQKEMEGKLNAAHTEEERTRIRAEAAERADVARQEVKHAHKGKNPGDTPAVVAPTYKKVEKRTVKDDPLDGLKL
jgi:colicin import membrane protein